MTHCKFTVDGKGDSGVLAVPENTTQHTLFPVGKFLTAVVAEVAVVSTWGSGPQWGSSACFTDSAARMFALAVVPWPY